MKRLPILFCAVLLCSSLTGCAYDYHGPAVGGGVAVSSSGVYAGSVTVGPAYYASPFVFPVLPPLVIGSHHRHHPRPVYRPAPPPRPHGPAVRPAPPRPHGPALRPAPSKPHGPALRPSRHPGQRPPAVRPGSRPSHRPSAIAPGGRGGPRPQAHRPGRPAHGGQRPR